jgi:hypothetical protein
MLPARRVEYQQRKAPARRTLALAIAFIAVAGGSVAAQEAKSAGTPPGPDTSGDGAKAKPADTPPGEGTSELPPLSNGPDSGSAGSDAAKSNAPPAGDSSSFIGGTSLDTVARGLAWHGYVQTYAAAGIRGGYKRDFLTFENRLQLEFETDVSPVLHIVGRPQLIYDGLTEQVHVAFRELYATRFYKKFDLSVGQRIHTWGITDFWPVVDIINPRDFSPIRNWKPIDEKIPVPTLHLSSVFGRVTLQALGIVLTRASQYQLDRTQPFAIPISIPDSIPILQDRPPTSLRGGAGGGVAMDVVLGTWKTSLYALLGRNPLPTAYGRVDPASGPEVRVENERVAMAAASAQGTLDFIGTLIKTEAAYYARVDDHCSGATEVPPGFPGIPPGTPNCFYLRRVPTARGTFAMEREIIEGLDVHLQLIGEYTRRQDIPPLPAVTMGLAPGLVTQPRINPIVTLRLQGSWARGDFRPSAFAYWSIADQAWFSNVDLEYHVADGFALAAGGFWFEGYAADPAKNRFTFGGSIEQSSNAYLRVTAWF